MFIFLRGPVKLSDSDHKKQTYVKYPGSAASLV